MKKAVFFLGMVSVANVLGMISADEAVLSKNPSNFEEVSSGNEGSKSKNLSHSVDEEIVTGLAYELFSATEKTYSLVNEISELSRKISELEDELVEKNDKIKQLRGKIELQNDRNEDAYRAIDEAERKQDELENNNKKLAKSLQESKNLNESLNRTIDELKEKNKEKDNEIKKLRSSLEESSNKKRGTSSEDVSYDDLLQYVCFLSEKNNALSKENENLTKNNKSLLEENKDLSKRNEDLVRENRDLWKQKEKLNEENSILLNDIDGLRKENDYLKDLSCNGGQILLDDISFSGIPLQQELESCKRKDRSYLLNGNTELLEKKSIINQQIDPLSEYSEDRVILEDTSFSGLSLRSRASDNEDFSYLGEIIAFDKKKPEQKGKNLTITVVPLQLKNSDWGLFERMGSLKDGVGILKRKGGDLIIKGSFVGNTLKVSENSDEIRYGWKGKKPFVFKLTGDVSGGFSISRGDFCEMPCWLFPRPALRLYTETSDGKMRAVIFTEDYIYKGMSHHSIPHGSGHMLKNTGEVLVGKFDNGKYIGTE